jgi:hypothetical protein
MITTTLTLCLLSAAPAKAQPRPPPPATATTKADATDPSAKAKELFQWAQRLYKQARYAEAISKFEEAYALKPHPVIYFNIGKCHEQLGDTAKALRAYRDYLRLSPDASDRETVNDAIANLERRLKEKGVQQLMVFAEPSSAIIEVDGKPLGSSPASVELPAGNHKLSVKAPGFDPVERAFVMSTAHATEMTISLRAQAKAEPPPPPPPLVVADKDAPKKVDLTPSGKADVSISTGPSTPRGPRVFTWLALGVGAAAAGTGVALGLSAQNNANSLRTAPEPFKPGDAQALASKATGMATGANVAYGVAGAAVVTAVVLFFVEGR